MKSVVIFTGAFDCGKTTVMEFLADRFGYSTHHEAHLAALAELGERTSGHPPNQPFQKLDRPGHVCPICTPLEFAELVLKCQRATETKAGDGDIIERGYLDPIEYYERNTGTHGEWNWSPIAEYRLVFLFEVMPELQRPRWGKSSAERISLCQQINARIRRFYETEGFEVVSVKPGAIEDRARFVHRRIS